MSFGDILEDVGGMGKFQILHVLLLVLPTFFVTMHNLLQNFLAVVPDHHCRVRLGANGSVNATPGPLTREELLRVLIPLDGDGRPEKCREYSSPQWHLLDPNATGLNATEAETRACAQGWEYDDSKFKASIVTAWDLVCEQKSLKWISQSVYMAGLLVGAIILGRLADKFGRKTLLLWSYCQLAATGTCAAFSTSYPLFCFWRFLCGVATSGILLNSFSLRVEWIPTRFRISVEMTSNYIYTAGQMLLAGIAYGIKHWRWLQFAISVPFFIFFLYGWWLPESARWLILNRKGDVALKQLRKVAKLNGKEAEGQKLTTEILKSKVANEQLITKHKHSVLDLYRTPVMRKIACCTMLVWFATGFAYYGLAIDLQGFGFDIYLIQFIFGAVDIPAKSIGFLIMSLIGRRFTQGSALILAGCVILANIFVPRELQALRASFAAIGKGCLATAFSCCYLYSGELYPTVVRQTGMGVVSTMARVGAMIAPIIRMTGDYVSFLPLAIYGGVAVIAGAAAFLLPETRNVPLPETIEEVENRALKDGEKDQKNEVSLLETHVSLMKQTV